MNASKPVRYFLVSFVLSLILYGALTEEVQSQAHMVIVVVLSVALFGTLAVYSWRNSFGEDGVERFFKSILRVMIAILIALIVAIVADGLITIGYKLLVRINGQSDTSFLQLRYILFIPPVYFIVEIIQRQLTEKS